MSIRFRLNGQWVAAEAPPTTTVLQWLRGNGHVGTKEGCGEGDCGACTVLLLEPGGPVRAVNSCLLLLPQIDGRALFTVEGLVDPDGKLHPAQQAIVDRLGSQCGYCTPGFVMSLVEAAHRTDLDEDWKLDDQICGNLCRCTGYRPLKEAIRDVAGTHPADGVARACAESEPERPVVHDAGGQQFRAPDALAGLWDALAELPDARIVAGGTDLGLEITQKHKVFPKLVSLERIAELRGIRQEGPAWRIGAATPLTDVESWAALELPVLHRMLRYFGSRQIKHRATIGGNVCTASPIGDLAPVMLALDASMVIASAVGERRVPMEVWFRGYRKTALEAGEILAAVEVVPPPASARLGAYKVSRRRELDISAVSACFRLEERDGVVSLVRLAFGGMAATTVRARRAEEALVGRPWSESAAEAAAIAVGEELSPMSDHRGSAWFRRRVAENLVRGFYLETKDQPFVEWPAGHTGAVLLPEVT